MDYETLSGTGIEVSRICLGCMNFGTGRYDWSLTQDEGEEIIDRAIDVGINFFDTANIYSHGESEQILGTALEGYDSKWPVIGTKVYTQMDEENPNSGGLSRKAIEQELEASLDRLSIDTIDLYQIHRWDYETPIEDTLRTLDDAVRRGKVRYLGASSMWAHQFSNALYTSDRLGLDRFRTMQNHYNLAYREEEREMLPFCLAEDVAVLPWSPLARGFLTRPHCEIEETKRGRTDDNLYNHPYAEEGGKTINERTEQIAEDKDVSMAQIALAWTLHKEWVDVPVVGTTSVEHLEEAVEALDISLSESDIEFLEEPYQPVSVSGHE